MSMGESQLGIWNGFVFLPSPEVLDGGMGWTRTCMLLPVTARIVHPTCVKTVTVGSQKSADRTRRTKGRFEETFFQ